jgi:hypothetical protein
MFMFQMREGRPVSEMGDVLDLIMTLFKYQHAAPAKSPEEEALAEDHAVAVCGGCSRSAGKRICSQNHHPPYR